MSLSDLGGWGLFVLHRDVHRSRGSGQGTFLTWKASLPNSGGCQLFAGLKQSCGCPKRWG